VATGSYPTRDRLLHLAGRADAATPEQAPEVSLEQVSGPTRMDLGLTAITPQVAPSTESKATAPSGGCCGGGASGGGCC
jgi:hypothetical protein